MLFTFKGNNIIAAASESIHSSKHAKVYQLRIVGNGMSKANICATPVVSYCCPNRWILITRGFSPTVLFILELGYTVQEVVKHVLVGKIKLEVYTVEKDNSTAIFPVPKVK